MIIVTVLCCIMSELISLSTYAVTHDSSCLSPYLTLLLLLRSLVITNPLPQCAVLIKLLRDIFCTRGTHIENLDQFFHGCWRYTLVSSCLYSKNFTKYMALPLVHIRQPLAESEFSTSFMKLKMSKPYPKKDIYPSYCSFSLIFL